MSRSSDENVSMKEAGRKPTEPNGNQKPRSELTGKQLKAIAEILAVGTMEEAARHTGISKTTLYEWQKQELFRTRLEEARADVFNEGLNRIKGATEKAARKLIELLDSRNENTRRLTAREVLALGMKVDETQRLEKRIEQLEEILAARAEGQK